jgi:hypothetical protein
MGSDVYNSVPIDTKRREIRLIEILPGQDNQLISCRFHGHELCSPDLEYAAISYTWGDPRSPTYNILVDGTTFTVRQNLWHFLRQERQFGHSYLLWIDAICIDQSKTSERNHQVSLMREIYSKVPKYLFFIQAMVSGL